MAGDAVGLADGAGAEHAASPTSRATATASGRRATIADGSTVIQSPEISVIVGNDVTSVVWNPIRRRFYAAIRYHGYYESTDGITWARLAKKSIRIVTTSSRAITPIGASARFISGIRVYDGCSGVGRAKPDRSVCAA